MLGPTVFDDSCSRVKTSTVGIIEVLTTIPACLLRHTVNKSHVDVG